MFVKIVEHQTKKIKNKKKKTFFHKKNEGVN